MRKFTLLLGLLAVSITSLFAQVPLASEDVMLQGFYWNSYQNYNNYGTTKWTDLEKQVNDIASSFDLIWLPPSAESGGGTGYHPKKWCNQTSIWGNKDKLKSLIAAFKAQGTRCIADIVINHRDSYMDWANFHNEDFGTYGKFDLWPSAQFICRDDEAAKAGHSCTGNNDAGYSWLTCGGGDTNNKGEISASGAYCASRDLDHSNTYLQKAIIAYLKWMKGEMGYDGWRYDLVKGYLGKYNKMYNDAAGAYLSVGEYWEDSYDDIKKWIQDTGYSSMAFDFPFKYAINNWGGGTDYNKLVWAENRVAGLAHSAEMRQYAITFIDNHDTASPHERPQEYYGDKEKANAIMLANAGIPCVFWPHWVNHKAAIKKMIAARKSAGIHSNSEVKVTCKNGYFESVAEGKNGTLICRVGSWSGTPAGYEVACSGNGWAYYIKGGKPIPVGPVVTMNPAGGYVGANGKVTLTTTKGTIYYTTDGSTPSASSTKYSSAITITKNNTVIKAIAIDGNTKSSVVSGTFLTEKPAGITVQFKAPNSWSQIYLYAWYGSGESVKELYGKWPGKLLSKNGEYYSYTITEADVLPFNIIFNAGKMDGTQQTGDIEVSADGCWDASSWSATDTGLAPNTCSSNPNPPVPPIPGGSITLKVKASSLPWGNTCYVHAWNGAEVEGGTNVNYTGAWPGQAMTLGNDGYYTYTLQKDMVYALFNDGKASNGQQTDDIQRITASTCYEISSDTHQNMMQKEVYTANETDCPTTGIDDIYATNVAIYPNPTSDKAIIASDKEVTYVSISNLSGWTVAASTSNEIDLSGLASAMYLVNIEFNDGSTVVKKIIKK